MKKTLFLFIVLIYTFFNSSAQETIREKDMITLYDHFIGIYNNEFQAQEDSSFELCEMKIVPIWANTKGYWLYVEKSTGRNTNNPTYQRIYLLEKNNKNEIECKVFKIIDSENYIGEWKKENPFDKINISNLIEEPQATIYFSKLNKEEFDGITNHISTTKNDNLESYTTLSINIYKDMIISWLRGFDIDNNQVAGSTKGGIIYSKLLQN